jgi:hypothetical protein
MVLHRPVELAGHFRQFANYIGFPLAQELRQKFENRCSTYTFRCSQRPRLVPGERCEPAVGPFRLDRIDHHATSPVRESVGAIPNEAAGAHAERTAGRGDAEVAFPSFQPVGGAPEQPIYAAPGAGF